MSLDRNKSSNLEQGEPLKTECLELLDLSSFVSLLKSSKKLNSIYKKSLPKRVSLSVQEFLKLLLLQGVKEIEVDEDLFRQFHQINNFFPDCYFSLLKPVNHEKKSDVPDLSKYTPEQTQQLSEHVVKYYEHNAKKFVDSLNLQKALDCYKKLLETNNNSKKHQFYVDMIQMCEKSLHLAKNNDKSAQRISIDEIKVSSNHATYFSQPKPSLADKARKFFRKP